MPTKPEKLIGWHGWHRSMPNQMPSLVVALRVAGGQINSVCLEAVGLTNNIPQVSISTLCIVGAKQELTMTWLWIKYGSRCGCCLDKIKCCFWPDCSFSNGQNSSTLNLRSAMGAKLQNKANDPQKRNVNAICMSIVGYLIHNLQLYTGWLQFLYYVYIIL